MFLSKTRMAGKRRWIAYAAGVRGRVIVNAGAREALTGGKASLLASGVVGVEGEFDAAEVVSIVDAEGTGIRARNFGLFARRRARDDRERIARRERRRARANRRATCW